MKYNGKIYFRDPPPNGDLTSLFRFMWDHGVGNTIDREGNPRPWTDLSLEGAFDSLGVNLDRRTIQNWLSGKNIPTRRNLYLLSRIASADDDTIKRKWSDAFIAARTQAKRSAIISRKEINKARIEVLSAPTKTATSTVQIAPRTSKFQPRATLLTTFAVAIMTLVFFVAVTNGLHRFKPPNEPLRTTTDKTIAVMPFKDLTEAQDHSFFSSGISEEVINALSQISEIRVKSRTASFAFRESTEPIDEMATQLGVNYFVEGSFQKNEDDFRLTARLVRALDGELIWSKIYDENTSEVFSAQEDIAGEIAKALDIYLDDEQRSAMFSFGTRDVKAYEHYLRGRYLLKGWHDSFENQDLIDANSEFRAAVAEDPAFGRAYFHNVDIYYHLAKGDLSELETIAISGSPAKARDRISDLLGQAQKHAENDTDRAQYRVNQIFFSDDWTGLRQAAREFATLAIQGRGELEWEFGPVILLLTGETELMLDLVSERILKYDPLNGTGHSYAVRAYLLEGDYAAAQEKLSQAQATTFSNRLDEVKGYLLFAQGQLNDLKSHAQTAENLSPVMREYFLILADPENEKNLLEAAPHLKEDAIHHSLALFHTGRFDEGKVEIDRILNQPLGTVLFPVILAYGGGCGSTPLPNNDRLDQRLREADIKSIPCIEAGK